MSLPEPAPTTAALVTGASSGIGTEIARTLARRGQNVILAARSESKLRELAGQIEELGVTATALPVDLSDRDARAEIPARVDALGLEVSILVNNAGLSTMGPVHRADVAAEMNMVEVDVMAVVDLCTRFLPGMVERGSGAILNVASTAAFQPLPGQAGYAGAKAFVLSYTQALSGELRGTGVTVSALCPGPVETGFAETAGITQDEAESSLPKFMWEPADAVARCGVDALAEGRTVAIPGAANRAGALLSRMAPRRLLVPLLASRHPRLKN